MDDSFDIDDASLIDALEQEEQMMASDAHPQTTPTSDVKQVSDNKEARHKNEARQEWLRPPPPAINPTTDTISFQQIDIDHYVAPPLAGMTGLQSGAAPILRMYGVTMDGNSVCAHLHGFLPYFYVNLPCEQFAAEHCSDFRIGLNQAVLGDMRTNKDSIATAVVSVEICERCVCVL